MSERPGNDPAPAITRGVAVLDLLAHHCSRGLPIGAIARELDMPRSSTANICASLEANGLVAAAGGGYRLGPRLLELGSKYLDTVDQVRQFYDLCEISTHVAQLTGRLAMLDGVDVIYLARYDGTQPLRLTASIGDRYPATITATGKAMLATLPEGDLDERLSKLHTLPRYTAKSIGTVEDLRQELRLTSARGWAIDDEETTGGVCCLAVPVFSRPGPTASYAVSVTLERSGLTDRLQGELLDDLHRIADGLTAPLHPRVRTPSGAA